MSNAHEQIECVSCYREKLFQSGESILKFEKKSSCNHTYHPLCLFGRIRFDGIDARCLLCNGQLLNSNLKASLVEKGIFPQTPERTINEFLLSKIYLFIFVFIVIDAALRTNNIFLSPVVRPLWDAFFSWTLNKDLILSIMNDYSRFNHCAAGSPVGCLLHAYDLSSAIISLAVLAPCWLMLTVFHVTFHSFG